jgi:sugar transferase (PEP-CTERM system associated)
MTARFKAFIVLFESLTFTVGFLFGVAARFPDVPLFDHEHLMAKAVTMTAVIQVCLHYNGLYDFKATYVHRSRFVRFVSGLVLANVGLALLYWIFPDLTVGRGVALLAMAFDIVAFSLWRLAISRYIRARPLRRVLILGDGELAIELAGMVRDYESVGYRFVGYLAPDAADVLLDGRIGKYADLSECVRRTQTDLVVVAMPDRRGAMPVAELLDLKFSGVEVMEGVDLYEVFTEKIYVKGLKPSWMIFGDGFRTTDARKFSKRVLDICVSVIAVIGAALPMALTALLVKLTSPGPAIYAQERVGEFGKIFTLYKFRSMRLDAESAGPQLAKNSDPRITRFGEFIRKTRLDELPQLFNVLRGDMSLVGPRPERPFFVVKLQRDIPFFRQRLFAKPGVTGLAQVKFRYAENPEDHVEKLQYDLAYIKNMSILYDLQIILETVKVMVFRQGAR